MIYAILNEEYIVTNIVESTYQVESNWVAVAPSMEVQIGDLYVNNLFYDQNNNPRLSADTRILADMIENLLKGIADA